MKTSPAKLNSAPTGAVLRCAALSLLAQEKYEEAKKTLTDKQAKNPETVWEAMERDPALEAERQSLLQEAFTEWSRDDLMTFLQANKRYGRHDIENIAREVDKPPADVQSYAEVRACVCAFCLFVCVQTGGVHPAAVQRCPVWFWRSAFGRAAQPR